MNAAELEQEQLDIEDEMNEEDDDSDSDSELLIQALRDRIRAAAYLQALGQKLPFGLHFGLIHTLPLAQEALRKVHEDDMKKVGSGARGGAPILLPFSCSEKNCGAKFTNWSLLNTHLNSHRLALRDDQDHDDDDDDGREEGELPLGGHHDIESMPAPQGCPLCGDKDALADLNTHVKVAHGIDGVVCPHCGKILSKACTLHRHIEQVHLNLQIHKPAKCEACGKMFSKKGHLDRHVRTIHMGIKDNSEPCPHCGKVFSTKSSLEPHIDMVHRGVRRECPECGKVLSDLWKHMRTVHGLYRRRAKIPKDQLLGGGGSTGEDNDVSLNDVYNVVSPSKSSSDNESQPPPLVVATPDMKKSIQNNNSNNNSSNNNKKNNNVKSSNKNKRKSSPPVKVKMSFNSSKLAKKVKTGKS